MCCWFWWAFLFVWRTDDACMLGLGGAAGRGEVRPDGPGADRAPAGEGPAWFHGGAVAPADRRVHTHHWGGGWHLLHPSWETARWINLVNLITRIPYGFSLSLSLWAYVICAFQISSRGGSLVHPSLSWKNFPPLLFWIYTLLLFCIFALSVCFPISIYSSFSSLSVSMYCFLFDISSFHLINGSWYAYNFYSCNVYNSYF